MKKPLSQHFKDAAENALCLGIIATIIAAPVAAYGSYQHATLETQTCTVTEVYSGDLTTRTSKGMEMHRPAEIVYTEQCGILVNDSMPPLFSGKERSSYEDISNSLHAGVTYKLANYTGFPNRDFNRIARVLDDGSGGSTPVVRPINFSIGFARHGIPLTRMP